MLATRDPSTCGYGPSVRRPSPVGWLVENLLSKSRVEEDWAIAVQDIERDFTIIYSESLASEIEAWTFQQSSRNKTLRCSRGCSH